MVPEGVSAIGAAPVAVADWPFGFIEELMVEELMAFSASLVDAPVDALDFPCSSATR